MPGVMEVLPTRRSTALSRQECKHGVCDPAVPLHGALTPAIRHW